MSTNENGIIVQSTNLSINVHFAVGALVLVSSTLIMRWCKLFGGRLSKYLKSNSKKAL